MPEKPVIVQCSKEGRVTGLGCRGRKPPVATLGNRCGRAYVLSDSHGETG